MHQLEKRLVDGLHPMGLDTGIAPRLLAYLDLMVKWNRVFNLTAVRDPAAMVTRHLLDSLSVLPFLTGERVLDVGSGAGLPGVPLAIADSRRQYVLLDSNLKRTRFLVQAATELALSNITVVRERIEDYQPEEGFDAVLARAYASVDRLVVSAGHCLRAGGRIIAMKGREPLDELAELPSGYHIAQIARTTVPGLEAERHLVILERD
jgi:16S rRNA (guanine527-N7)-methyltransferase